MNWQLIWRKRPLFPLVLILLLAFGLRLSGLNNQSLWWDELKTVQRAAMSAPELMTDLAGHRAHLPFYFLLMQLWHGLGESAFVIRYFSVVWGLLGVAAIFLLGQKAANRHIGLLAAFLLAISPFHIWYSQEARMYSFLPAILILAHVFLVMALQKKKWGFWILYALLMAAAVATHYFALLVLMAHYIFFVLHFRHLRPQAIRWLGSMLLAGLLLLPLAGFVFSSRSGETIATVPPWIPVIQWYDPLLTMWNFSVGPGIALENWLGYLGTAVFLLALIPILQKARSPKKQSISQQTLLVRLFLIWFGLPIGLIFLISFNWPFLPRNPFSLYLDRYLLISLPPFLLLVAWGIENYAIENTEDFGVFSAEKQYLRPFFLTVAVVGCSISIWQLNHNPDHWRNDWRAAFALIQEDSTSSVILGQQDVILPLDFYGDEQMLFVQLPPPDGTVISTAYTEAMEKQIETAINQKSQLVWHIEPFYNNDTHLFPETRKEQMADESESMAQTWLKAYFTILAQYQLPGLRLTLYDLVAGK